MAYSLIAHTSARSSDSNGITTSSIDTTGADTIFIVSSNYQGATAPTISDSKSNTWNKLTEYSVPGNDRVTIYYAKNATVGSGHTFTSSGTGSFPSIAVAAFSGGHLTAPFDVENGNHGSSSVATGSVTPSEDNEVIIFGCSTDGSASGLTVDVGSIIESQSTSGGAAYGVALAYQIQTTATARNATWAKTGDSLAVAAATFKQAAAAATIYWGYGDPEQFPARRHLTSIVRLEDAIWPSTVVATPSQFGYNVEPQFPVRTRRHERLIDHAVPTPPVAQTPTQQGFDWLPFFPVRRRFQPTRQEQPEVYPATTTPTPSVLGWDTPTFQWIRRKFHLFQGDPEYAPNEPPPAPTGVIRVIRATILRAGSLLRRY